MAQGAFDAGLFVVSRGQSRARVDASDTHEERVGVDSANGFHACGSNGDDGVLEKTAAKKDHFNVRVVQQLDGDGGAMRDYRCFEVERNVPRDFASCGAAVQNDDLTGLNHLCGGSSDCN